MSDTIFAGTISGFDRMQGFGLITTSDGRELRFDVGVCRFTDPRVGEEVRLELGPSRLGGERVAWVERTRAQRLARASTAPPRASVSDLALVEMIGAADKPLRDLLQELLYRRSAHFRAHHTLGAILERVARTRGDVSIDELVAELRALQATFTPD